MADRRRVSVHLELEVAGYLGSAAEAAAVTRRVSSSIDDLGDELDKTGHDLNQLAANTDFAASRVDELGDEAIQTTAELMVLEKQLHSTSRAARGADMTPSTSRVGKAASGAGNGLLDFGAPGLRPRNAAIFGIVEAVALAAPTIGAMISGAVVGAVGVGGIAGGIVAASNSPAVKQAATNFAGNISAAFTQYGDQFVEPLVRSFDILEQGFHDLNLEDAFEKVAAYVDDIARGLAGFGRNMMPGLMSTLDRAGPILEILGRELPRLGTAFGNMFATIASGKGTVEGFYFLMGTIKFTFEAVGATLKFLSDAFHEWIGFVATLSGALEDTTLGAFSEQMAELNDITEDFIAKSNTGGQVMNYVGREMQITAGSVQATADAIRGLTDAMFEQHSAALALANTQLAQAETWLRLRESVKEHGTSLRRNTEEGLANNRMINDLIGGILAMREANIDNKMSVDEANRIYAAQIKRLQEALKQMGFNEEQILDLVSAYKQIPTRITTQIITEYQTRGKPPGEHSGLRIGEGRAAGGPVLEGRLYPVNEQRPEVFLAPANGMVVPLAAMSPMAMSGDVHVHVTSYGDRFSTQQVLDDLALHGAR